MCYGSKCDFEDSMGECRVNDYTKVREKYNLSACVIGGSLLAECDQEFINENEEKFKEIRKEMLESKLSW
jgi:hypothetical protein